MQVRIRCPWDLDRAPIARGRGHDLLLGAKVKAKSADENPNGSKNVTDSSSFPSPRTPTTGARQADYCRADHSGVV